MNECFTPYLHSYVYTAQCSRCVIYRVKSRYRSLARVQCACVCVCVKLSKRNDRATHKKRGRVVTRASSSENASAAQTNVFYNGKCDGYIYFCSEGRVLGLDGTSGQILYICNAERISARKRNRSRAARGVLPRDLLLCDDILSPRRGTETHYTRDCTPKTTVFSS